MRAWGTWWAYIRVTMRPGGSVRVSRRRFTIWAAGLAWLVALTVALAPSSAPAKGHSHVPKCTHVSRKAMAKLAQTGTLDLLKKIGNLCEFTGKGEHKKHYRPTFEIQIVPYFSSVWNLAKSKAKSTAAKNGDDFGETNKHLFFVSGEIKSSDLGKCNKHNDKPGQGGAKFGPACKGEPVADHFTVIGNGTDKRAGLKLMVSAGLTGQRGDVHLSHMIELVKEILSGKIH
jgi:hypothetical protein